MGITMFHRRNEHNEDLQLHPHQWHFQDCPTERRHSKAAEIPRVPSHCVFQDVAIPYPQSHADVFESSLELYPTPGHIASHLLLLECFQKLESNSKLFSFQLGAVSTLAKSRSIKESPSVCWSRYMKTAYKRFQLWVSKIESILRHSAAFNRYGTGSHLHGAFTENYLPPLDVLLVWYCYQQNSHAYQQLLSDNHFRLLGQICFPWHLFPTVIDQDTLEYKLSVPARKLWQNFIGIPIQIEDCLELDLNDKDAALTIPVDEFLHIAQQEMKFVGYMCDHHWLRSPSLLGTLRRGLQRYESTLMPPEIVKSRAISEIHLDAVLSLILQTHRAYPALWQSFLNEYKLTDDDAQPQLPSYHPEFMGSSYKDTEDKGVVVSSVELNSDTPSTCFCWICERVRDEIELQQLSSVPGKQSDAKTQASSSCCPFDTTDPLTRLNLSKEQTKAIKTEINLYRSAELLRQRRHSIL